MDDNWRYGDDLRSAILLGGVNNVEQGPEQRDDDVGSIGLAAMSQSAAPRQGADIILYWYNIFYQVNSTNVFYIAIVIVAPKAYFLIFLQLI